VAAPDNGRPRAAIELRFVAVAISWHLNRDTGDAWPGFATLAKETGLRQRTVIRAVKWLESKGHLHVTHSRGGNVPNRYRPIPVSSDLGDTAIEASSDLGDTTAVTKLADSSDSRVTRTSKEPLTNLLESSSGADARLAPSNSQTEKQGGASEKGKRRKKQATELPDSWSPNLQSVHNGERLGLSAAEFSREAQKFRNHAKQNARTAVRWDAAFDNWLIKAAEFLNKSPAVQTTNGSAQVIEFKALPDSAAFQAWRTHYRDTGQNAMVRELDRRIEEGRPFNFPSEWPPDCAVRS
jgi:helix-turn-helix protein